jgi:hypothetical protein
MAWLMLSCGTSWGQYGRALLSLSVHNIMQLEIPTVSVPREEHSLPASMGSKINEFKDLKGMKNCRKHV